MQKLIKTKTYYDSEIQKFNTDYLDNGWVIVKVIDYDKGNNEVFLIIQKDTRKEKLNKINNT